MDGWLHTEVVCPPKDSHSSQYQPTNGVAAWHRTHDHYVASPTTQPLHTTEPLIFKIISLLDINQSVNLLKYTHQTCMQSFRGVFVQRCYINIFHFTLHVLLPYLVKLQNYNCYQFPCHLCMYDLGIYPASLVAV